jgi:hypothetical protein
MAGTRPAAKLPGVEDRTVEITLEIRVAGDELHGCVRTHGAEEPHAFAGWLGLLGVLDSLIAGRTPRPSPPSSPVNDQGGSP